MKFDYISNFNGGIAYVKLDNKYNIINKHKRVLSNIWFDYIDRHNNKVMIMDTVVMVRKNKTYNFITKTGKLLSSIWFDYIYGFYDSGCAVVSLNGKHNIINKNGKILFSIWFDWLYVINNHIFIVKKNNKFNIINVLNKKYFISKMWFDYIKYNKSNICFIICLNNNVYEIDRYGNVKHTKYEHYFY